MVESQPSKLLVAGSIPVSRSRMVVDRDQGLADVAQLAERVLGKGEVTGSIPVISSRSTGNREQGTGISKCIERSDAPQESE